MTKRFIRKTFFIILLFSAFNFKEIIYAQDNGLEDRTAISITINGLVGSIVTFPEPVISITGSKQYLIQPVRGSKDASGTISDVAEFLITPTDPKKNAREEVTFILFSKRSYIISFNSTPTGEKYFNLKAYENRKIRKSTSAVQYDFTNFLSTETKLMKAMLFDSSAQFQRTVVNELISFSPYDSQLSVNLVRIFKGPNLTGYTLIFRNKSSSTLKIAPQNLSIGFPNKALMVQADRYVLTSCGRNQRECKTAVRYVVGETTSAGPENKDSFQMRDSSMPFMMTNPSG